MVDGVVAVILNYRQAGLTARCVASLVEQVSRVVIVDNSANIAEHEKLSEALSTVPQLEYMARIDLLDTGANLGFARGVQYGLRYAVQSDFSAILVINNDAIAGVAMVERLMQHLQMHDGRALVAPRAGNGSTPSMLWYHRLLALVLRRSVPGAFPYLSGACLLVPPEMLKTDLFDPDFFMYGEDVELSWRAQKAGLKLVVAEDASYHHLGSVSSRLGSSFYEYQVARGHVVLADKLSTSYVGKMWLLLGRILSLSARAIVRCVRNKTLMPYAMFLQALAGKGRVSP